MAKTAALAIGAAMVAGAGALAVAMKGVINEADKMAKMAQAIGVPIDELSRLKHAADLAGIDLDTLGKAVKRLSAGMLDASEAGTGPAARAFTMLGIQVRDSANNMRPASAVMQELAGRFAKMPNGVEKTALAMRIFGKSGADLIPLLNAGSDGLAEMYAEAEELGIVLDEKTGKAAEEFEDVVALQSPSTSPIP
jgi:TP901 family phage tail tape measure protein